MRETYPAKLTTTNLSAGWSSKKRNVVLFEGLNLSLCAGKLVCLMGPNGSGKSTLLRTLAGLQKPLAGSVAPGNNSGDLPRMISLVLTNRVSVVGMTVRELVAFGRYPYLAWDINLTDNDLRFIDEAIDRVQIRDIAAKEVSELSDGQMQMTMIARALAQDTPIILLDEPTAHLDLNNRVNIMKLLKYLSREMSKAILLATHELDLALQTADLIWLTRNDRGISSGVPEDLVLNGAFDETFQFKGFDLRTGKVRHELYRGTTIYVDGSGPEYLWTRNALERSGLEVAGPDEEYKGSALHVKVVVDEDKPHWLLKKNNQLFKLGSIAELIELL